MVTVSNKITKLTKGKSSLLNWYTFHTDEEFNPTPQRLGEDVCN
jgi:hypothetical protein